MSFCFSCQLTTTISSVLHNFVTHDETSRRRRRRLLQIRFRFAGANNEPRCLVKLLIALKQGKESGGKRAIKIRSRFTRTSHKKRRHFQLWVDEDQVYLFLLMLPCFGADTAKRKKKNVNEILSIIFMLQHIVWRSKVATTRVGGNLRMTLKAKRVRDWNQHRAS